MHDETLTARAVRDMACDIAAFSRVAIESHALRPYQIPVARAVADSVVNARGMELAAVFSRQSGKDELLAQLCAWLLWTRQYAGGSIVVALPALRPQGIISRDHVIARLSGSLTAGKARVREGAIVQLGQAQARFLSAAPTASSRGNTASLLLVANEAQDIDVDTWDAVFAPMGASTNVTTLFMGTVWTSTTLLARQLRLLADLERRDGRQRRFIVPWRVVAAELPAYGAYVRRQMDLLGEQHPFIRTEYELQELDGDGGLFPPERREPLRGPFRPLSRPAPNDPPGAQYAFTIDVAGEEEDGLEGSIVRRARPRRDSTALSVVRVVPGERGQPSYDIVARYEWTGTRHTTLHDRIAALVTRVWHARHIVIDATGIGAGLASFLTATLGERVVAPFIFSSVSKSSLAWDLLSLIDAGRLRVYTPAAGDDAEQIRLDALFWKQLAACRFTVLPGPGRLIRWGVEDDTLHDDLLMSTALVAVLDRLDWRPRQARGFPPISAHI
ncbi:MAG TPA: hypothetical protein VMM78_13930 [Thermomicrobiales bacterium]|nr:hypothetical protein [Thermomicrobiales bacterium]